MLRMTVVVSTASGFQLSLSTTSFAQGAETSPSHPPTVGILGSNHQSLAVEGADGLGPLTVAVSWSKAEPEPGVVCKPVGDVFSGSPPSGDGGANTVADMAARAAEATYLAWLRKQMAPGSIIAIRQGGGPFDELRYPSSSYNGHGVQLLGLRRQHP
jgi:hypothetical protein